MSDFVFSEHSVQEMKRRSISQEQVEEVMRNPQQKVIGKHQRMIYQSQITTEEGKPYLIRVVVDQEVMPIVVITVYITSKIQKYWKTP